MNPELLLNFYLLPAQAVSLPLHCYSPGLSLSLLLCCHAMLRICRGKQLASVLQDEDEPVTPGKRRTGGRKRKGRSAVPEAECSDRDHWEECAACQHWVNLGKGGQGQEGLQGRCEHCGGQVEWKGHEEVQSWIQCDACGRWRTVPDTVLRQVVVLSVRCTDVQPNLQALTYSSQEVCCSHAGHAQICLGLHV